MRKITRIKLLLTATLLSIIFYAFGQDRMIPYSEMPEKIQSYVSTHFPNLKVIKSKLDTELSGDEYEIVLADGTELEFNNRYEIISMEGAGKLPDSVIPTAVLQYTQSNYPNAYINEWEQKFGRQKIELNTGLELIFDRNGKFIGIDD